MSVTKPTAVVVLRTYRVNGRVTPADGQVRVRLLRWNGAVYGQVAAVWADGATFALPLSLDRAPASAHLRVQVVWPDRRSLTTAAWTTTALPRADVAVSLVGRAQLPRTYRSGCPVGPSSLRRLTASFRGWTGRWERGSIIVARWAVTDVSGVLDSAARAGFPIRKLRPVDGYGGSDVRSMAADNTSAFNCRKVTGNPYRWSRHSWGDALDLNPYENPYVTSARVYPSGSTRFLDRRTYRPGMVLPGSAVHRAFAWRGWQWGARWSNPDYQHFSRTGA